eukprot:m.78029 g.78029  ORF g.78029 m.78029 type:complete len:122 (+) comp36086_c0_seq7:13-378(+)
MFAVPVSSLVLFSAFTFLLPSAGSVWAPKTFVFDSEALLNVKNRIKEGRATKWEDSSFRHLLEMADRKMFDGPWSVMMKPMTPPSGDKHDFESLATYYWPCNNHTMFPTPPPNCNMTTGLP